MDELFIEELTVWFVSLMSFLVITGFWMFVGLLACAVLLKVFSMVFDVTAMELVEMIVDLWISKINKLGGNGGKDNG